MKPKDELSRTLKRIDRKGYKAYKDIAGVYDFGGYILAVDHVQGDPFAAPSRLCVITPRSASRFSPDLFSNRIRLTAAADFLTRSFARAAKQIVRGNRGIGKSGMVGVDRPGQEVLPRNSCVIGEDSIQVRFVAGLPAAGRTILGNEAQAMLFEEIPHIVEASLRAGSVDEGAFREHVDAVEDQEALRERLDDMGLVAFVGDGSVLPRRSGVDDRPLTRDAVPFQSPESLRVSVDLPHRGTVSGMGVPRGVTLIVGGGFHGKSTLLTALERGVYPHVPGDGRELVATAPGAVKIRAEDGRYIERVNISPFITNLPHGRDTGAFSTDNASGSTSQAANIIESLEMGAKTLLIDEDTSATNFMIRDERMQELISKEKEPITPFVDKVKKLHRDHGVSTVLVMGGSGDYFDVADTVIAMDTYLPRDVSDRAAEIAGRHAAVRTDEGGEDFGEITRRTPVPDCFDPSRGRRDVKIDAKGLHKILYGTDDIDLSGMSQLIDESQTRAIGAIIHQYATRYATRGLTLADGVREVYRDMEEKGLDDLVPYRTGNLAKPRIYEVAGAINRMRTLSVK